MTAVAMKDELERLRAENAALKEQNNGRFKLKVSDKGGVSLYGLGRFPVTLYREQWNFLLEHVDDIKKFLSENASKLKSK
jgi:hypothetical protein